MWTHGVTQKADCWLPSRIQALPLPFAGCSAPLALIVCIESELKTGKVYSQIGLFNAQEIKVIQENLFFLQKKSHFFCSYSVTRNISVAQWWCPL